MCLVLTACSTEGKGKPADGAASAVPPSVSEFTPTEDNRDPTKKIDGVEEQNYSAGDHVEGAERVAYDRVPPIGGSHDQMWATCNGVVYPRAVRTEHMVHSLEHGAVWIAYDPERIKGDDVDVLAARVDGQPYSIMSPYPGLPAPVSVQSWGRQLRVESAADERIDQFMTATRANPYLTPEPGATCDSVSPDLFDQDNQPAFNAEKPGPDAVPVTGR
ncbi:MAG: DUF3105 domain-containing protein [Actinomycetota bacterium]|nr:DUF3105 domain-containing protein [Actinomycetota bacterium]